MIAKQSSRADDHGTHPDRAANVLAVSWAKRLGELPISVPKEWGKEILRRTIDSPIVQGSVALVTRVLPVPTVQLIHYDVPMPGLPPRFDGLRVLHVSDLHCCTSGPLVEQVPALVAGCVDHDLMIWTGDFIDTDEDLPRLAALLSRIPRRAPAYAVLGNHDHAPFGKIGYHNDVARLKSLLAAEGVSVLSNASEALWQGDLFVAGVDDPATGRDDLRKALRHVRDGACCILLAHSPDIVLRLGPYRPSLIVSGHTHGGQVRLPWLGAVLTMSKVPRRLAMGVHRYLGVPLFVTRGIGYSGLDIRLNCPPEVALLTLRSPANEQAGAGSEPAILWRHGQGHWSDTARKEVSL